MKLHAPPPLTRLAPAACGTDRDGGLGGRSRSGVGVHDLRPDGELHDLEAVSPVHDLGAVEIDLVEVLRFPETAQEQGDQLVVEAAPLHPDLARLGVEPGQPEALGRALRELGEHVHRPAARAVEAVDHVDLLLQAGLLQLEGRHLVELRLELLDVVLHLRDADLRHRDLVRDAQVPEADRTQREQQHQHQLHELLADVRLATRLSDGK